MTPQIGIRLLLWISVASLLPQWKVGAFRTSLAFSCRFPSTALWERKPGVASPAELAAFVSDAGDALLVVDVRNPDSEAEPGDQKSLAVAALPSDTNRPQALHLIWDRKSSSLPIPDVPKDTPIITHCGGGGRGQLAKDFLLEKGFTNVLNGGL